IKRDLVHLDDCAVLFARAGFLWRRVADRHTHRPVYTFRGRVVPRGPTATDQKHPDRYRAEQGDDEQRSSHAARALLVFAAATCSPSAASSSRSNVRFRLGKISASSSFT